MDDQPSGYHLGMVSLVFLLIAAVLFGVAMFNIAARVNLVAAGLLSWVLASLIPMIMN